MEKQKCPEIRFGKFKEAWLETILGDVVDIVGGGTPDTNVPEFWNGEIDWYSPTEIGNGVYANGSVKTITKLGLKNSSAKILPAKKTVLFSSRAGIGDMAILNKDAATNQGFQSFIANKIDVYFLYSMGFKIKKFALSKASGSTFLEISRNQLAQMEFLAPSTDSAEQKDIGSFFQNLDQSITLHEKKIAQTQNFKKAMLEKIFPKQGSKRPEIRLKGFSGDWSQFKLKDFGEAYSGTALEAEFDKKGKYKVISIGSYSLNSVYVDQGLRANRTEKTKDRILQKNDLTMVLNDKTLSGEIIGRVLLIDEDDKYVFNQRTQRIIVNKEVFDPHFLYHLLNADQIRKKVIALSQGNTQIYVNWSAIQTLEYFLPSKDEQIRIANFFKKIDDSLILQRQQLQTLKNLKQAFLEKMFV